MNSNLSKVDRSGACCSNNPGRELSQSKKITGCGGKTAGGGEMLGQSATEVELKESEWHVTAEDEV